MIVLFTDFGWNGPYVRQMKARILEHALAVPLIDLLHDAPQYDFRRASYLLASYASAFPPGSHLVAVIDPGVGSSLREPVIVEADGRLYIGPGNGLFDQIIQQASHLVGGARPLHPLQGPRLPGALRHLRPGRLHRSGADVPLAGSLWEAGPRVNLNPP